MSRDRPPPRACPCGVRVGRPFADPPNRRERLMADARRDRQQYGHPGCLQDLVEALEARADRSAPGRPTRGSAGTRPRARGSAAAPPRARPAPRAARRHQRRSRRPARGRAGRACARRPARAARCRAARGNTRNAGRPPDLPNTEVAVVRDAAGRLRIEQQAREHRRIYNPLGRLGQAARLRSSRDARDPPGFRAATSSASASPTGTPSCGRTSTT